MGGVALAAQRGIEDILRGDSEVRSIIHPFIHIFSRKLQIGLDIVVVL